MWSAARHAWCRRTRDTLGDLFVFPSPGNGIPAGDYYRFLLDINQDKSEPAYLSLDKLRVFVSSTGSINDPLDASGNLPGATLVWNLDAAGYSCGNASGGGACQASPPGQDNGALLNYALNSGSGNGYYWIPQQDKILMLFLFAKNEQSDLNADQLRKLKRTVEEELL